MAENLGKVSLTMGGDYSASVTYPRLTVVRGVDGDSYVSKSAVTGISPGVTSGWETYWQLLAEDSTGTNVSVTPTLSTGTKLATILVDGTQKDIYTPTVQINGNSIVNGGAANIPLAGAANPGVVKVSGSNGIAVSGDGTISVSSIAGVVSISEHTMIFV